MSLPPTSACLPQVMATYIDDRGSPEAAACQPASAALTLAAGHLIEAGVDAHRFRNHSDAARRLGVSHTRASRLAVLTALAPDIQTDVLDLRAGGALGQLSERTLLEVVATHADWQVQRWWWSLLAQPFDPNWLAEWVPPRTAFPSGRRCRRGDRALGDLPLDDLADLVACRPGRRQVKGRREELLVALADGGAGAPAIAPAVIVIGAMAPAALVAEFERLHSHRPPSRHPDYLRRRVAWAVQAAKEGGLPKPISGRVMELRDHLPIRWREAFAGVARVHVTRAHRVERGRKRSIG